MKLFVLLKRGDYAGSYGMPTTTCEATHAVLAETIEQAAQKLGGSLSTEKSRDEGRRFIGPEEKPSPRDEFKTWLKQVAFVR